MFLSFILSFLKWSFLESSLKIVLKLILKFLKNQLKLNQCEAHKHFDTFHVIIVVTIYHLFDEEITELILRVLRFREVDFLVVKSFDEQVNVLILEFVNFLSQMVGKNFQVLLHDLLEFQAPHNISDTGRIDLPLLGAILLYNMLQNYEKKLLEFLLFSCVQWLNEGHEVVAKCDQFVISLEANIRLLAEKVAERCLALREAYS